MLLHEVAKKYGWSGHMVALRMHWLAFLASTTPVTAHPGAHRQSAEAKNLTEHDFVMRFETMKADVPDRRRYSVDWGYGRSVKLHLEASNEAVFLPDMPCNPDFQSWCTKYPSHEDLFETAVLTLLEERTNKPRSERQRGPV